MLRVRRRVRPDPVLDLRDGLERVEEGAVRLARAAQQVDVRVVEAWEHEATARIDGLPRAARDLVTPDRGDPPAIDGDAAGAGVPEHGPVDDREVGHRPMLRGRAGRGRRVRYDQGVIELRSTAEIEAMRPAGRFVAEVLTELATHVAPGVSLLELDGVAHAMIRDRGAASCYIDYHPSFGAMPFGKVLCTSVNDAVLHGLPHDYRLKDGDNVSLDFAAEVDGWVADSAITCFVGTPPDEDVEMYEAAERALAAGIAAAVPGNRVGDISSAIGDIINDAGYAVNTSFGGHGVGHTMHQAPDVPNWGEPGRGLQLRAGLVIAIEPWFLAGDGSIRMDKDGWTIRSGDRTRGVHVEHTVAITADGPIVLTDRSGLTPAS